MTAVKHTYATYSLGLIISPKEWLTSFIIISTLEKSFQTATTALRSHSSLKSNSNLAHNLFLAATYAKPIDEALIVFTCKDNLQAWVRY